jgi:hypothetical protein
VNQPEASGWVSSGAPAILRGFEPDRRLEKARRQRRDDLRRRHDLFVPVRVPKRQVHAQFGQAHVRYARAEPQPVRREDPHEGPDHQGRPAGEPQRLRVLVQAGEPMRGFARYPPEDHIAFGVLREAGKTELGHERADG